MADNFNSLQNVEFNVLNRSDNLDVAYFLDKHSETLTSLAISTGLSPEPLTAILKCKNLKKLCLDQAYAPQKDLNCKGLERLVNLRCLHICMYTNSDLGHIIEAAKFRHLNEIKLSFMDNLSDEDIIAIAQAYGEQVN
jgi:hypothetical protein